MPTVSVRGLKLNYLVRGDGPPMILSHGFQNSGFAFTPILDRLAERFQVFALDKRGTVTRTSRRDPIEFRTSLMICSDFLMPWVLRRWIFSGTAWAGRTGTLFAIDHSDRLNRLMLVSSSAGAPSGAYREHFEVLHQLSLKEGMEAVFEHHEFRRLLPPKMLEGPLAKEYKTRFLKNTPDTYAATANALFKMPDLTGRLGEISVPTLICYGENDPGPLDFSDIYLERISDCTRIILPNSGHFPIWDATDALMEAFDEFLAKHAN